MKNIFKKISIIFACFGLVALFSLPCVLSLDRKEDISQVRAEDEPDFSPLEDLILYPVGDFNVTEYHEGLKSDSVYFFSLGSVDYDNLSSFTLTLPLQYICVANSGPVDYSLKLFRHSPLTLLNFRIVYDSDSGVVSCSIILKYTLSDTVTVSILANHGVYFVPFNTFEFNDNSVVLKNFINQSYAKPVYNADYGYYIQLSSYLSEKENEILTLTNSISLLESEISSLESEISSLEDAILSLEQADSSLLAEINNYYSTNYNSLSSAFLGLKGRIQELTNLLNIYPNSYQLKNLIDVALGYSGGDTLTDAIVTISEVYTSAKSDLVFERSRVATLIEEKYALNLQIEQLENEIEDLNNQIDSLGVVNNVFNLIKSAFSGIVPLFDYELGPNLTIGMILTIPFVVAIIGFAIRLIS